MNNLWQVRLMGEDLSRETWGLRMSKFLGKCRKTPRSTSSLPMCATNGTVHVPLIYLPIESKKSQGIITHKAQGMWREEYKGGFYLPHRGYKASGWP